MSDYIVRQAVDGDLRFVMKSWIDTYRSADAAGMLSISPLQVPCKGCGALQGYDYATVMAWTITKLLQRPGLKVLVAANPRARPPNDLHGFIVYEMLANVPTYRPPLYELVIRVSSDPLVHYVVVKKIYRKLGIGRALFKAAGIDPSRPFLHTCHTPALSALQREGKVPGAIWAPASARFEKETSQIHDSNGSATPIQQPRTFPAAR